MVTSVLARDKPDHESESGVTRPRAIQRSTRPGLVPPGTFSYGVAGFFAFGEGDLNSDFFFRPRA